MLGKRVKDLISGLEGIAIFRTQWLYGCNRIGVAPQSTQDGKPAETQCFDEQRVEVVGDGPVEAVAAKVVKVNLGDQARDTVSGFKGRVVAITTNLSGRVDIGLETEGLHEGKPIDAQHFEGDRIELVKESKPPMSSTADPKAPGGPQKDPRPKTYTPK